MIWIISILMLAFSLVTVYSFVPILVKIEGGTPFYYLFKHFMYVILAFFSMYTIHRIDSKYIFQISKFAYYLAIILLIFTMIFGVNVNGADRWIRIPFIGLTFQSSDFAKLALILYLSRLLVKKENKLDHWKEGFATFIAHNSDLWSYSKRQFIYCPHAFCFIVYPIVYWENAMVEIDKHYWWWAGAFVSGNYGS